MDPDDYECLNKYKWHVNTCEHTFYAVRNLGGTRNRKVIKMHRQVMKAPDWLFVDHKNHNGLDNRKANLRLATRTQNSWNRRKAKTKGCSSKFKGVSWHKYEKRWQARIQVNKMRKTIGYFDDEIEAAKAYDTAAKKYFGDFAVLNFATKVRRI